MCFYFTFNEYDLNLMVEYSNKILVLILRLTKILKVFRFWSMIKKQIGVTD